MSRDAAARIVIVGGGPAGGTCALTLADAGIPCTLLDDNPAAGGQVWRTGAAESAPPLAHHDRRGDEMRRRIAAHGALIDYRPGHEVVGFFPPRRLWARDGDRVYDLTPEALVVAAGALEIWAPVPGWTLPGVYGLGGLQIMMKTSRVVPTGKVVLAGAGPLLRLVAVQMATLGADIVAVVDAAPLPTLGQLARMASIPALLAKGLAFEADLLRRGIRVLRSHAVVRIEGDGAAAEVLVAPVDAEWRPQAGPLRRLVAQTVGLGYGVRPNIELTRLAGCEHTFDRLRGGWHAKRSRDLETTVESLFVAGDGGGINGVDVAIAEGTIAAAAVARKLGLPATLGEAETAARKTIESLRPFRDALADWSNPRPGIFAAATDDTIVCRCEDVTKGAIAAAVEAGFTLIGPVKMSTRAGMGLCQGRTCTPAVQGVMALAAGKPLAEIEPPTARAPLRPVPLKALAALVPETAAE